MGNDGEEEDQEEEPLDAEIRLIPGESAQGELHALPIFGHENHVRTSIIYLDHGKGSLPLRAIVLLFNRFYFNPLQWMRYSPLSVIVLP